MLTRIVFLAVLPVALAACSVLEELKNPTGPTDPEAEEAVSSEEVVPLASEEAISSEEVVPLASEEAFQALEDLGVPYNQRSFIEQAGEGNLEVVRLFIWAGMDVNVQPYTARTVLVPTRENPTALSHLESSWFPQEDQDDDTALMKAAGGGPLEVVKFLLENWADREIKNQQGQDALMFASAYGPLEVVRFLAEGWYEPCVELCMARMEADIEAGIIDDIPPGHDFIGEDCRNECYSSGLGNTNLGMNWDPLLHGPRTNIQWAAYNGHLDVVEYLYPLLKVRRYQWPHLAFSMAVLGDHMDIVNWFIGNRHSRDKIGVSRGLMIAAYMNHVDIVDRLLQLEEVNIHWRMSEWIGLNTPEGRLYFKRIGFGPPHAAIQAGNMEPLRLILKHWMLKYGADGRDDYGMTALHFAAAGGDLEMARTLIDNGAPVNGQSDIGMTPLMFAAQWGRADIVVMLLAEGADASLASAYDETALLLAQEGGHEDVVALLQ